MSHLDGNAAAGVLSEVFARELTTAIATCAACATHTRVRFTMMGYSEAPGFEALYAFFDRGRAFTLTKLRERIERGPVDWQAERTTAMEQR